MSEFNSQTNKLTIKLVYYGPALSGKTTNLMCLHDLLQPAMKGELMTLETKNDRTLFFDLLPLGFTTASGLMVKFKLFTVPGQVAHDSTRKAVLSRADGVVFVADSQRSQGVNNSLSFQNLVDNVSRIGIDIENLPLVVQFNKRDLPDIYSEEEIQKRWHSTQWPVTFSTATTGAGVASTFEQLIQKVYSSVNKHYCLAEKYGLRMQEFVNAVMVTEETAGW
jgi:signal recognition particle receptor subunit beta